MNFIRDTYEPNNSLVNLDFIVGIRCVRWCKPRIVYQIHFYSASTTPIIWPYDSNETLKISYSRIYKLLFGEDIKPEDVPYIEKP